MTFLEQDLDNYKKGRLKFPFRNLEKGLEVKPSPFYHFEDLQYLISYLFLVRAFRMKSAGIINTAIRRAMI